MPLEISFFATALAAGIIEGASVLARAKQERDAAPTASILSPQLLIPAVLYGSISLPLGIIGASPGPTMIGYLPFAPNADAIFLRTHQRPASAALPPPPPVVEAPAPETTAAAATTTNPKGVRRVDLLRVENRDRQVRSSGASSPATQIPIRRRVAPPSLPTRYLATLDGQALPTSLAEAMRRTRFLLIGAGLVTVALSYNQTRPEQKKKIRLRSTAILPGKDAAAIRRLVANSTQGAVLRYCDSLPQLLSASTSAKTSSNTSVATIPLYSQSISSDVLFWNPGSEPKEWETTPISNDWLMKTAGEDATSKQLLVMEADVTPTLTSIQHYFSFSLPDDTKQKQKSIVDASSQSTASLTNNLSKSMLLFHSLIESAASNPAFHSVSTVQVVLGCAGKPALPLPENVVYMDGSIGLGVEVESVLEQMHEQVKSKLLEAKTESQQRRAKVHLGIDESNVLENPDPTGASAEDSETSAIAIVNDTFFAFIDTVGSSIRRTIMWPVVQIQGLQEDYAFWRLQANNRVVHVLSDQRTFVQFLQRSLHADWRIVWYDATKDSDVSLYQQREAAGIAIVCCSTDETTRAFLMATASNNKELQTQQVLSILIDKQAQDEEVEATTISIREVHENLFAQVRVLLSEGKTVEEVQEIVDLIR